MPELAYIVSVFRERGVLEQFGAVQMHDDTVTQSGDTIASVAWLQANAPSLVPIVNQVGGASAPQSLYRSDLFISSPEQYPIQCPDGNCSSINATRGRVQTMQYNANNAVVDARFGLDSWPLFQIGAGTGPNDTEPDRGTMNVRSRTSPPPPYR